MPHWNGNNYNRNKELPKFLANINTEALYKYGINKTNKSFLLSHNKDNLVQMSTTNNQTIPCCTIRYKTNATNKIL